MYVLLVARLSKLVDTKAAGGTGKKDAPNIASAPLNVQNMKPRKRTGH